jgi:hypothetical protein
VVSASSCVVYVHTPIIIVLLIIQKVTKFPYVNFRGIVNNLHILTIKGG